MAFTEILPTPINLINLAGEDATGGHAGPGFAQMMLKSKESIQHSKYASGRYDLSRAATPHVWEANIEYNKLLCEDFHTVYAFLLRKQETMEPYYIQLPQYLSQGVTNKSVSASGGFGYNTIIIADDTDSVPIGSFFTCPNEKLYCVTRVETYTDYAIDQPSAGTSRLHVSPTFQDTVSSGTLDFTDPMLKVRTTGSLGYTVDASGLFSFSLTAEEVKV